VYRKNISIQINQADATISRARASLVQDQQNLIIRVAEAYLAYLKAKDSAKFFQLETKAFARQFQQVKAFFDAERAAITDVKEAQARYDLTNAQVEIAKQQIDVSRETLRAITTRYYKSLNGAADKIPLLTPKPNNIDVWTQSAIVNSKQLMAAEHAVQVAQKLVDIERAARSPKLDLFAKQTGGTRFGEDHIDQDRLDASIGVQFSMPIYQGGNISSRIREARHKLHQAQQQLELQKRLATQQTRAAYFTIISGLAQVKALRQALNSTQTAASATQAGFEAGTRTAVDVLLSLRETFSARRDYTTARYDFLLNTLKLKKATGVLSEADLAGVSKLLKQKSKPPK
jgi:outer membrane protein